MTHPDNATLVGAISKLGHLPLPYVRWDGAKLTIALPSCSEYREACDVLGIAPAPGRLVRGHRVYDSASRDGVTVVEHLCWPHLDCWGAA